MSDAALSDESSHSKDGANQAERFADFESDLAQQRDTTNTMRDLLVDIQQSIMALAAAQTAPKRPKLPAVPEPDTAKTIAPPALPRNRLRPGVPSDYAGEREKGRAFMNSCTLYMSLCAAEFADDQARILWVLSYMKSGRASEFADHIIEYRELRNRDYYADWAAFRTAFVAKFWPQDEATVALLRLESEGYYQGKRTVEEYLDEFETLIKRSGYREDLGIVMKFRKGLNREIQNKIAELGTGQRPADDQPDLWYDAARVLDRNRMANDVFQNTSTRRATTTTPANAAPARGAFVRFAPPAPPLANPPARLPLRSPFPNVPFAPPVRDANREKPSAVICYRCGEPGHTSRDCPRRIDVRGLSAIEREELFQDLLAAKDVVTEEPTVVARVEAEEDEEEEKSQPAGFAHRNE
jgi:hypothetical protein